MLTPVARRGRHQRIIGKQPTVDQRNVFLAKLAALIHALEQPSHHLPNVCSAFLIVGFCGAARKQIAKKLRWEQHALAHILAIESEDEPVQQALGQAGGQHLFAHAHATVHLDRAFGAPARTHVEVADHGPMARVPAGHDGRVPTFRRSAGRANEEPSPGQAEMRRTVGQSIAHRQPAPVTPPRDPEPPALGPFPNRPRRDQLFIAADQGRHLDVQSVAHVFPAKPVESSDAIHVVRLACVSTLHRSERSTEDHSPLVLRARLD